MIGVDTNILIRFLVHDDEKQFGRVDRFFSERTVGDPAFIALVVVVETAWVLRRQYRFSAEAIAKAIMALVGADEVVIQAPDVVRRAIRDTEGTGVDLADAIIAQLGIDADCDETVTFDRRAAELPGMRLLE
jgi:predicted nucleic-acid-binding protein